MSDTMIVGIISAGGTLLVTLITQASTIFISKFKSNLEIKHMEHQVKRENLNEVYKHLISIINLFPVESPNDVLNCVEFAPNYSMEHFDSILQSLDYQIDDYKRQLNIPNIDYERKSDIEIQISNREYSKEKIAEIRDKYHKAKDEYKIFNETDKVIFDLYAGQEVRNCLVEFDVVIHNVFISGYRAGNVDDPINNKIKIACRTLIDSVRYDIGI